MTSTKKVNEKPQSFDVFDGFPQWVFAEELVQALERDIAEQETSAEL